MWAVTSLGRYMQKTCSALLGTKYNTPVLYGDTDSIFVKGVIIEKSTIEETAISFTTGKKSDKIARDILKMSVKASKVFDYPERSLKGRVISVAFLFALDDNKALPEVKPQAGEAKRVFWMPLAEAVSKPEIWFEDHYHILQWAITQKGVQ